MPRLHTMYSARLRIGPMSHLEPPHVVGSNKVPHHRELLYPPITVLIVTGTKRSGTSMWMQILIGAGFPAFGEAFPRNWSESIGEANPDGFYESSLRHGIYWRTNPHPKSGAFFRPEQVQRHVVKVFIPGLVRSDLAYIGKVIATIRPWREYVRSIERLQKMELEHASREGRPLRVPVTMPPHLEWWVENYGLIRDYTIRRYPIHVQTYGSLTEQPAQVIESVLEWLGDGNLEGAIAAFKPQNRTQHSPNVEGVPAELTDVFDELYDRLHARTPLPATFIRSLNRLNESLLPELAGWEARIAADPNRRRLPTGAPTSTGEGS